MRERSSGERNLAAITTVACLLASTGAEASDRGEPALASSSLSFGRAAGDFADAECVRLDCSAKRRTGRLDFGTEQRIGATLVEFPVFDPTGRPQRPRHGIGLRSTAMQSALQSIGVDAAVCYAPIVRMHTKLSSGLNLSGTLLVSLRCSFY